MLAIGDTIDGAWRVTGVLGHGGLGAVYRCDDLRTGETCAVKVLTPPSQKVRSRLETRAIREAEVLGRMDHPGIVRVLGHGTDARRDIAYLVMELVEGQPLTPDHLRTGGEVDLPRMRAVFGTLLDALTFAHEAGVAHRDLKWQNILLRTDGRPVLVDWGSVFTDTEERLTRFDDSGGLGRTDLFAPPEALMNAAGANPYLWDLYSLGVILYEAVTGAEVPYADCDNRHELVLYKMANPLDAGEAIDERLRAIIAWCTAPLPERRPKTARALRTALVDGQGSPPPLDVRASRASGATSVPSHRSDPTVLPDAWEDAAPPTTATRIPDDAPDVDEIAASAARPSKRLVWLAAALGLVSLVALGLALTQGASEAPTPAVVPAVVERTEAPPSAAVEPEAAAPAIPPEAVAVAEVRPPPQVTRPPMGEPEPKVEAPVVVAPQPPPPVAPPVVTPPSPPSGGLVSTLLVAPVGEVVKRLAANPAEASAVVTQLSQKAPTEEAQREHNLLYARLVREMNGRVDLGYKVIEGLARANQLDELVRVPKFGQGADYDVALLDRLAELAPPSVRAPADAAACRKVEAYVDLVGRPGVVELHAWVPAACQACAAIVGRSIGKCEVLHAR